LVGVLLLPVVLLAFQAVATALDRGRYPPPGQLFDVGGYRLHVYCVGSGSPTVILDTHNGGTVSYWTWVQPAVAGLTRVCAYDREGLGWSDQSPTPLDARQNAEALHALLQHAGVAGPLVLVGHSFGGLYTRAYADRYPDEVAGMVLIEATNPDFLAARGKADVMPGADPGMMDAAPVASRFGLFRFVQFFPPPAGLPERQRAEIGAYYATSEFAETLKRQFHLFPTLLAQVRAMGDLGDRPLAVVLGTRGDGGIADLQPLFERQAALSSRGAIRRVEGADHISLVADERHARETSQSIHDVVEAARAR
jgi:pimeloyl-ACP methyl ester carboxylesterase